MRHLPSLSSSFLEHIRNQCSIHVPPWTREERKERMHEASEAATRDADQHRGERGDDRIRSYVDEDFEREETHPARAGENERRQTALTLRHC